MKKIGLLPLGVSLCLLIFFSSPKVGISNPLVDTTGCLISGCHDATIPDGRLHSFHENTDCTICHELVDDTPLSSTCIECHPNIYNSQKCDLVDAHEITEADCETCHIDCQFPPEGFCRGLADYDYDVDGSDASTFKSHFGRSIFQSPCPPDGPAPVPKTGQTVSYATGDDGDLERGIEKPPLKDRFTDNSDGTVTDNLTGLIWLKDANCYGMRTWYNALSDSHGLASGQCGLTDGSQAGDWRLPNKKELISLIHDGYYNPALSNTAGTGQWSQGDPFTNVHSDGYWSSTTVAQFTDYAWYVGMGNGGVKYYYGKTSLYYVWPVRGGH